MYIAWGISFLSMLISLIMSDYLNFPPCTLCWYQRVFMYALVFIIPTGLIIRDTKIAIYVRVLSCVGGLIAIYHNLIYYGLVEEGLKICTADLSCKTRQFELFGFVGIPMMSLLSFISIFILSLKGQTNEQGS